MEEKILELKNIQKIINKIPVNKLVFWVGAGIDANAPTSLPLGGGLTNSVLKLSCASQYENVLRIWNNSYKYISDSTNNKINISSQPRLETVIEIIREFESHQFKKESIINAFKVFSSSYFSPNREHFILAYLLHLGANIVTTNYGDFISFAYKKLYGIDKIFHKQSDLHIYQTCNKWKSSIYHIHGVSNDLKTIGVNLSNVKKKLPNSFIDKFIYWFKNGYYFIYLGYSGLDTLDVNPFLVSQMNKSNKATGVYIRHTSSCSKVHSKVTNNEKVLLCPFKNKYICPCKTSDFLSFYKNFDGMDFEDDNSNEIWSDIFNQVAIKYSQDCSNTFLLGLCYKLGINITSIFPAEEWIEITSKYSNIDQWYINYYIFENASIVGDFKSIESKGLYLLKRKDYLAEIDYLYFTGNIEQVLKMMPSISFLKKQVKTCIETKTTVDWNISTQLNRHVDILIFEILENPAMFLTLIKRIQNLNILKKLIYCFTSIVEGGYDFTCEVNQINTAYRSLAICQALNNDAITTSINNLNTALINYADISSINGVVLTELYLSLILMIDYCLNNHVESLKKAQSQLILSNRLINGLSMCRYKNRLNKIELLYDYLINHLY